MASQQTEQISPTKTHRVYFLDEVRGICILLMVIFHGAYDVIYIFGMDIPIFHSYILQHVLQPLVAGIFVFLSGIACRYSRNNLRRGLIALGFGMVLTVVTRLFMPEQAILFGILHLLGSCMILFGLVSMAQKAFYKKLPGAPRFHPMAGLVGGLLLFCFLYGVPKGWVGFLDLIKLPLSPSLYSTDFLFALGLPGPSFWSTDYFPLLPWVLLFAAGSFAGVYFKEGKMPAFFYRSHSKALGLVGRNTIWIYLLHQPVVYGLLWLIFTISTKITSG